MDQSSSNNNHTSYYTQQQLQSLSNETYKHLNNLLCHFGILLNNNHKSSSGCCPIHGGDNLNAFHIWENNSWKCFSQQCERYFNNNAIGLIRGILSHQKYNWQGPGDKKVSFNDTIKFLSQFINKQCGKDIVKLSNNKLNNINNSDKYRIIDDVKCQKEISSILTQYQIRQKLQIPSQYYINRGYTPQILNKYDVGLCKDTKKPMSNRVVIPVYDKNYKYIGCTGRSVFNQCEKCKSWHSPKYDCPPKQYLKIYSKWKHTFTTGEYLYNHWNSHKHIRKTGVTILVESPGNVWRLEEANIKNSVGLFNTTLSDRQQILLDISGTMSIIILTDNDNAGQKARDVLKTQCNRLYHVYIPQFPKNDIGELTINEVNEYIKPTIQKAIKELNLQSD